MDASEIRGILLGPAFNPRVEDIPTPPLLLDKGVPAESLRLVSMSAQARLALSDVSTNGLTTMALYIASCLRLRDSGGTDGRGTHVLSAIDARVLTEQDFDLQSTLGKVVGDFLGIAPVAAVVASEKKDSPTAPANAGGSALPTNSESLPTEQSSPSSTTETTPDGSPTSS